MKVQMQIEVLACSPEKNSIDFYDVDVVTFRGKKKRSDGNMADTSEEVRAITKNPLKPGIYSAEINISAKSKGKDSGCFSFTIVRVEEPEKQNLKK